MNYQPATPLPRRHPALPATLIALFFIPWVTARQSEQDPAPAPAVGRDDFVPDASAPFLPWDQAWPPRWNRQAERLQGVIRQLDLKVTTLRPNRMTSNVAPTADDVEDFKLLTGAGGDGEVAFELEGPNSIVFRSVEGPRRRGLGTGPGPDAGPAPAFVFRFISGEPIPDPQDPAAKPKVIRLQRTWFAYYEPVGERTDSGRAPAPDTRATVLLLPGMFGNPEPMLDGLVRTLRQRGYAVLRMLCQPSRFTERITLRIDPQHLEESAREIARQFDNRTAECAYAAEAAWAFIEEKRPAAKSLPRLSIGMSGGAITLPTTVARQPDRYAAAVLIAGAADYWLTSQRSNYQLMIGAVTVVWEGDGPAPQLQPSLDEFYLQHARLDSFHTAKTLHGKPLLVLHGLADHAVPSALGEILWERLGRPERWTYPFGHEMLFAGLPAEFPRLLAWLDATLEKLKTPAANSS